MTSNILSQMWLWPEILYHLAEHLNEDELSRYSLVCHAWNNAFAPILWASITIGSKSQPSSWKPPIESLQTKAPWIRSIAYLSHDTTDQFSLGPECRWLRSLTFNGPIPFNDTFDKSYSDSCRLLIRQNRATLRHLELDGMVFIQTKNKAKDKVGVPNWSPFESFAFGKHTGLRSLKVTYVQVFGEHRAAFWTLCERLEVLHMKGGSYGLPGGGRKRQVRRAVASGTAAAGLDGANNNNNNNNNNSSSNNNSGGTGGCSSYRYEDSVDADPDWITSKRFPKLVDLKLKFLVEGTYKQYMESIVTQCPRLKRLKWDRYMVETEFLDLFLGYLIKPELRATTWPDLEDLDMYILNNGQHAAQVIETWPVGKLQRVDCLLHRVPDQVFQRLLDLHSGSLREIDLSRVDVCSRKWVHRFLDMCPTLEKIKSQAINIQAFVDDDRPEWVCERLQEWKIYIDMDPRSFDPPRCLTRSFEEQRVWCQRVFERLGRLKQLRVLDMRLHIMDSQFHATAYAPKESLLHLSLEMGLGALRGLSKLKELGFQGDQTMIRRRDVRWMIEHWVQLKRIQGGMLSNRREAAIAGKKKFVWDFEYGRMLERCGICPPSSLNGVREEAYLCPRKVELLAATSDE
ncbi:hypothetical protein BGX23_006130 [Mortierella sp. AD031]|nr:hypothetical protein BGX23_006130 [Mortierella sp. AD031]